MSALAGTQRIGVIRQFDFGDKHIGRVANFRTWPDAGQRAVNRFAQSAVETQINRVTDRDMPVISRRDCDFDP